MEAFLGHIKEVLNFVYHNFLNETLVVQVVWVSIVLFFFTFIISLLVVVYYKRHRKKAKKEREKILKIYQPLIIKAIAGGDKALDHINVLSNQIKKVKHKKCHRNTILSIIIKLHRSLSDDLANNLEQIYILSELNKYSLKKLKNKSWNIKIEGIRELSQMNCIQSMSKHIVKMFTSKKEVLLFELRLAFLKNRGGEALNFVNNYKNDFNEWHQIEFMEMLFNLKGPTFEYIDNWLTSQNASINLFALKIVKSYSLIDKKNQIINLVKSKNFKVRREAIRVILKFKIKDAYPALLSAYEFNDNYFEKRRLLSALKTLDFENFENYILVEQQKLNQQFRYKTITIKS